MKRSTLKRVAPGFPFCMLLWSIPMGVGDGHALRLSVTESRAKFRGNPRAHTREMRISESPRNSAIPPMCAASSKRLSPILSVSTRLGPTKHFAERAFVVHPLSVFARFDAISWGSKKMFAPHQSTRVFVQPWRLRHTLLLVLTSSPRRGKNNTRAAHATVCCYTMLGDVLSDAVGSGSLTQPNSLHYTARHAQLQSACN